MSSTTTTTTSGVRFRTRQPRFAVEQITCCENLSDLARRTGFSVRSVQRWKSEGGVPLKAADEIAVRLGFHPANIWPTWFETDTDIDIRD